LYNAYDLKSNLKSSGIHEKKEEKAAAASFCAILIYTLGGMVIWSGNGQMHGGGKVRL
jgi:hypothetical protein